MKVLLIEDDDDLREIIIRSLQKERYVVEAAATLEEAREWCQTCVNWYRFEHHHSGIKFLLPIRSGLYSRLARGGGDK